MVVDKKKKRKAIRKRSVVKPRRTKRQESGTKISIRINTAESKRMPPASRGELITSYVSGQTRLKTDAERLFGGEPSNVLVPLKKLPTPDVTAPPLETKIPPVSSARATTPKIPAKRTYVRRTKATDISEPPSTEKKRGPKPKVEFLGDVPDTPKVIKSDEED